MEVYDSKLEKKFISELEKEKLTQFNQEKAEQDNLSKRIGDLEVELLIMKNNSAQFKIEHTKRFEEFKSELFQKYGEVNISNEGEIQLIESQDSK